MDAVVLLDAINTQGITAGSPEETSAYHAAVLAQLTLTGVAPALHELLNHGRGALHPHGLYISIGAAQAVFSTSAAQEQIATVLCNRMTAAILKQADEPGIRPGAMPDQWIAGVEAKLLAGNVGPHGATLAEPLATEGAQSLGAIFARLDHHVGSLLAFMDERENALRRLQDRARVRLENFLTEFAPWYIRFRLGKLSVPTPLPVTTVHESLDMVRVAILVICGVGMLASGVTWNYLGGTPLPVIIPLLLCALGALAVLIAGLYVRTTDVQYPPPSKQRDMMAELKSYRAACHIAAALLERHRATSAAFRLNLDQVRNVSAAGIADDSMALPEELIDSLLKARQVDSASALRAFWLAPKQDLSRIGEAEPDLANRLRAHAREACAVFSDLTMGDVLRLLKEPAELDNSFLGRIVDRLQAESSPWIPVPGKTLKTVVALPSSVGPQIRDAILNRLGRPAASVETSRELLAVIQLTQGYVGESNRSAAAGRM